MPYLEHNVAGMLNNRERIPKWIELFGTHCIINSDFYKFDKCPYLQFTKKYIIHKISLQTHKIKLKKLIYRVFDGRTRCACMYAMVNNKYQLLNNKTIL